MNATLQSLLAPFSSRHSSVPASSSERISFSNPQLETPRRRIHLRAGEIIRIEREDEINALSVTNGVLWLTATPAISGDVILQAGETFETSRHPSWPWVIQALEAAVVVVR